MLAKFLGLFGFDLHGQIRLLKDKVEQFAAETGEKVKEQAKNIGLMIGFAIAGGILGLITFIILLMALYTWISTAYGEPAGFAVVGGLTAALTAVMFALAMSRGKSTSKDVVPARTTARASVGNTAVDPQAFTPPPHAPSATPEPPARPAWTTSPSFSIPLAVGDLKRPLSEAVTEFLSSVPVTGTSIDSVVKQMTREAASASGQTVNMASDLVRTGSRKAAFGVLAGCALLGWFLARRGGSPYSIEGFASPSGGKERPVV